MADSLVTHILSTLCRQRQKLIIGFSVMVVFLLVTIVGFTVIPPDSPTFVVNVVNLVTLSVLIVACGGLLVYCDRTDAGLK